MAGKFCIVCGCENPPERGACLMCYAPLGAAGGGQVCPECGAESLADARFCGSCGVPLSEGLQAPAGLRAMAGLVVEVTGENYVAAGTEELAEEHEMVEMGEAAIAGEKLLPQVATAEEAGPVTVPVEVEEEEEYIPPPPPPGALDLETEVPEPAAAVQPAESPEDIDLGAVWEAVEASPPPPEPVNLEEEEPEEEPAERPPEDWSLGG